MIKSQSQLEKPSRYALPRVTKIQTLNLPNTLMCTRSSTCGARMASD